MDQEPNTQLFMPELKAIDVWCHRHLPLVLAFLVEGLLVALQEWFIAVKAKAAVDKAIEDYEAQEVSPPDPLEGIIRTSGHDFFDEMRITSRFVVDQERQSQEPTTNAQTNQTSDEQT